MNNISLPKLKRKHFLCRGDLHTPRLVHYVLLGAPGSILQYPSLHLLWENSGYGYNSGPGEEVMHYVTVVCGFP